MRQHLKTSATALISVQKVYFLFFFCYTLQDSCTFGLLSLYSASCSSIYELLQASPCPFINMFVKSLTFWSPAIKLSFKWKPAEFICFQNEIKSAALKSLKTIWKTGWNLLFGTRVFFSLIEDARNTIACKEKKNKKNQLVLGWKFIFWLLKISYFKNWMRYYFSLLLSLNYLN